MKVMFFISSLRGGGAERAVVNISKALVARGYNVVIVADMSNQIAYSVDESVKLKDIGISFKDNVKRSKFFRRLINRCYYEYILFKNIKSALAEEKPDILISFMRMAIYQLLYFSKKKHYPLIFSERSTMDKKYGIKSSLLNRFNRYFLISFADAVTILTNYDKAYLRNKIKRKIVIPNVISYAPLTRQDYELLFSKRKHILACGSLLWYKGFDKLIKAFSIISVRFPDWNLDIAGGGDKGYLETIAKQYGVQDRVNFLGFRKDIDALMKQHSVFVLSSFFEGFPNVLCEAMSNGCACIAFDCITGPNEIIVDSIDGVLVENQNVEELSETMNKVMQDENLRYKLGLHAIDNIQRFSADRVVDKWEKLFNKLVK